MLNLSKDRNWSTRTVRYRPTQEKHRTFQSANLAHDFGDGAENGLYRSWMGIREATQWTCNTGQLGKQWWEETCWRIHRKRKLQTLKKKEQSVGPSGTDSRCNNSHAEATWLWWGWWHRRPSKGLEAFAKEILECGGADSSDLGGKDCSTVARGVWGARQLIHQRTGGDHKALKSRWNLFNVSVINIIPIRYERFVIQESLSQIKNVTHLKKAAKFLQQYSADTRDKMV